jgi:hypothetical protein
MNMAFVVLVFAPPARRSATGMKLAALADASV